VRSKPPASPRRPGSGGIRPPLSDLSDRFLSLRSWFHGWSVFPQTGRPFRALGSATYANLRTTANTAVTENIVSASETERGCPSRKHALDTARAVKVFAQDGILFGRAAAAHKPRSELRPACGKTNNHHRRSKAFRAASKRADQESGAWHPDLVRRSPRANRVLSGLGCALNSGKAPGCPARP